MSETVPAKPTLGVGQCATLACLLEATAPKPGNVHRGADFADMTYFDLVASGIAIAPAMEDAANTPLGMTILTAIQATRSVVTTNTNLGIVLLLAPLATAQEMSAANVQSVLAATDLQDARNVYAAIRLAKPGGMGEQLAEDVATEPSVPLIETMRLASEKDTIARQYVSSLADVFEIADWLADESNAARSLDAAIVRTQLRVLAKIPDSLIMRKCGATVAQEASDRAADVLSQGRADDEAYEEGLAGLDFWMRASKNHRNPGTTADLITAALFVLLRQGRLRGPFTFYAGAAT